MPSSSVLTLILIIRRHQLALLRGCRNVVLDTLRAVLQPTSIDARRHSPSAYNHVAGFLLPSLEVPDAPPVHPDVLSKLDLLHARDLTRFPKSVTEGKPGYLPSTIHAADSTAVSR